MVTSFLPDTNILVYALKGIDPYASWFSRVIKEDKLAISSIVVAEFLSGASKEEVLILKPLTQKVKVIPVDLKVAEVGARYRRTFAGKTKKVWLFDCLIAATAKIYGLTLVTSNKKDYPMKDMKIVTAVSE